MRKTGHPAISIYSEETPNPATMKFVANTLLYPDGMVDFTDKNETDTSPLAATLFNFPFVRQVFIASNFVTLTKTKEAVWKNIVPRIHLFLQDYLEEGYPVMNPSLSSKESMPPQEESGEDIVSRIKSILDTRVKPVVEMDGGAIYFERYQNGVLTVSLHGACHGCPSSMKTLKNGVESIMKRNIPEINEVIEAE